MKAEYINALSGAGKSYALVQNADRLARLGEIVIIIQPTKDLIDKTIADEFGKLSTNYPIKAIHSGNHSNVMGAIIKHLRATQLGVGQVLMITHEAFFRLPRLPNRQYQVLLCDEVISASDCEVRNLPVTHKIITDLVDVCPDDPEYGILKPKSGFYGRIANVLNQTLSSIANNKQKDDVVDVVKGFARKLKSPHWECHVKLSSYCSLTEHGSKSQLHIHSLLKPSIFEGFKRVIIASALFEESLLSLYWRTLPNVKLIEAGPEVVKGLRYTEHANGHLLKIYYVGEGAWSKNKRNKIVCVNGLEQNTLYHVRDLIKSQMANLPFVWMGNTDIEDSFFDDCNAVRLPNTPHGLNSYTTYDHAVVLSALNPPPSHFKFMDWKGISDRELRTAIYRSAVYQAIMRTSLRDPASQSPKSVIVMDYETAEWLSCLFRGSDVCKLGGSLDLADSVPHRQRQHASNAEKQAAYRRRKETQKAILGELDRLNANLSPCPDGRSPTPLEVFGPRSKEQLYGTIFDSIYDTDISLRLPQTADGFIQFLKDAHKCRLVSKDDHFLVCPSVFNLVPVEGTKLRSRANVMFTRGIWFDNDGGGLTPDEFARLFPKIRMVIFNTFSSTSGCLRWRCFIPTNIAMTQEAHKLVMTQLLNIIRNEGYQLGAGGDEAGKGGLPRPSGFDTSKFGCEALFYAPCQANDPSGTFFRDYNDEGRCELDVRAVIANCNSRILDEFIEDDSVEPEVLLDVSTPANQQTMILSAINRWRSAQKGSGNIGFFKLALSLHRSGLDRRELINTLQREAHHAHSPGQRKAQIKSIVSSIFSGRFMR